MRKNQTVRLACDPIAHQASTLSKLACPRPILSAFEKEWIPSALAIIWLLLVPYAFGRAEETTSRVLILCDENGKLRAVETIEQSLKETIQESAAGRVEFYHEYLDSSRFRESSHHKLFADYLKAKYSSMEIDVIVPIIGSRVEWGEKIPHELFPDVPIVLASCLTGDEDQLQLASEMTAVIFQIDVAQALKVALAVRPSTQKVVIVSGSVTMYPELIDTTKAVAENYQGVEFEYWTEQTAQEILDSASEITDDSIVLYLELFRDATGAAFIPWKFGQLLAQAANVPVFGIYESYLDTGIVGGAMVDWHLFGQETGKRVLRILNGESASAIPVMKATIAVPMFDWRAMEQWDIQEKYLPPGSIVRYRSPSVWEAYRNHIITMVAVVVLQTIMIGLLLIQKKRRSWAENELRKNEEQLRLITDSLPACISYLDSDLRYIFVNESYAKFAGKQRSQILGKQIQEVLREDIYQMKHDKIAKVLSGESITFEILMESTDSESRHLLVTYVPDINGNKTQGFFASIHDVTDLEKARKEARVAQENLYHVGRVTMLEALSSSLSHEIQQPLTGALSNAQAAEILIKNPTPDINEIEVIIKDVIADIKRAGDIMWQMRAFLRKEETSLKHLDLNGLIEEVLSMLNSDMVVHNIVIEKELDANLPNVTGDSLQLKQVLVNLGMNAQQIMKKLTSGVRRMTFCTFVNSDGQVTVSVEDNGPGVKDEQLKNIFDPFYTTKKEGTGMGLAISRFIIESHGGRIWAENKPEGGARISFSLPAKEDFNHDG